MHAHMDARAHGCAHTHTPPFHATPSLSPVCSAVTAVAGGTGRTRRGIHGAHAASGPVALTCVTTCGGLCRSSPSMRGSEPGGIHCPTSPGDVEEVSPAHKAQAGPGGASLSPCPCSHPGKAGRTGLSGFTYTCQIPSPYFCCNDLLRAPRSSSPVQNHQAWSFGEIKS